MAALMERLGLAGREMMLTGHSKDFVLKVVQPSLVGLMDVIRYRYFRMSFLMSAMQVILGGTLVFVSGILIGSA